MTAVDTQGIDGAAIEGLAAKFQGRLVTPDAPDYDQVRQIWNGHIQRRPALIARCTGVADVIAAVRFGRDQGLNPAVRGGGHAIAGHAVCDDGLVIDLSTMTGTRVDPQARTIQPRAAASTPTSTGRPRPSGWPPPAGSSATPASVD